LSYYFIILNIKQLKLKQDEKDKYNKQNRRNDSSVNQLKKEVDEGLSNVEKSLPSKYFMIKQEMLFFIKNHAFTRVLCNSICMKFLKHKVRQL
jgi:hypothetical protein